MRNNLTPGPQNLHCIACDAELENLGGENSLQPNDGMVFHSCGHYGTTFFDPCTGDYIEIVVCDKCLQKRFGLKSI